ncbi:exodeoxyribonuclease VII small subunit [Gemelliphila palaticanis]|uniref:Exodeoxyribonuclease 7 small subunit n=1 Tax=Gemelliphila palaticanis TaxID=81950 RepID=A0ABX2T0H0_9BACL|nr:exodeoxyribonuclease VII small subunit [Gemella palaticanis]MBF0715741.1 exodeoxyribonuclease VII small subunit [Gemella palaticanis]NYS47671.1 exodeoxyribonuclease VII small subunit [Gemella palaticanis]
MMKNSFEDKLLELENIIKNLESNELSLDDSLEQYKNGIDIIKSCNLIIKNAEEEVSKLSEELNNE